MSESEGSVEPPKGARAATAPLLPAPPSTELYQRFPAGIRRIYSEALAARDLHKRHGLLLDLAESSLVYLASLALSDYRSRAAQPSDAVESLLERLRAANVTFGLSLALFRASAAAAPDTLFPTTGPLANRRLPAVERLGAAMDCIDAAVDGLLPDANPSGIDVGFYVTRALDAQARGVKWWGAWTRLVEYRNLVYHAAARRWPIHNDDYYKWLTPLLHDAVVELLTHPPAAEAVLCHPLATITLRTTDGAGQTRHTVCGEVRGVWTEHEIAMPESVTELWATDEWRATDASTYVLEEDDSGAFTIRALYWDLHQSPPPPLDLPSSEGAAALSVESPSRRLERSGTALEGRGSAPGTCGEFVQGLLPDGTDFHVTCPINKSATVVVEIRQAPELSIVGLLPEQSKLDLALRYTAEHFALGAVELRVRHWSDLDVGKGMSSSTADVLSGIRAVANALGDPLSPEREGELATRVESSDGTMYPGVAVVNHKTGEKLRHWPWFPEFVIVMLVPRDSVDTEAISFDGKANHANEYQQLLVDIERAVEQRSAEAFAAQATRSAALNAPYLVNPYAQTLSTRLEEFGALGLNVGHTGTVCGLLYPNTDDGQVRASQACFELRQIYHDLRDVKVVTTPRCPV